MRKFCPQEIQSSATQESLVFKCFESRNLRIIDKVLHTRFPGTPNITHNQKSISFRLNQHITSNFVCSIKKKGPV